MLLLLDTRNDKHFTGEDAVDLATATGRVRFDLDARVCVIQHVDQPHLYVNPTSHTLTWGDDWKRDEMLRDMARDAIAYLCRNCGFTLFTSKD